jgi:PAS domain S-box-containing protein
MSRAAEQLRQKRENLTVVLQALLRETAFDNRYSLHPRQLVAIGSEVTEAFLRFLDASDEAGVKASGGRLAREGLGEKTILKLTSRLRTFFRMELNAGAQVHSATFDAVEHFTTSLLDGFLSAREAQILTDQEQLRRALSTALASQSQELLIKNLAVNTSINGIMLADLEGKVTWVNSSYLRMWGCQSAEEVLGLHFSGFWVGDEGERILAALPQSGGWHGQLQALRRDGGVFSVELSVSQIRNEEGNPVGIMTSVVDITEHLKAEEMEKNLLLAKEIHHRIKNNLQVISSLLFLQSEYVQDNRTREMFKESQNRVRSMALLYQKLYQSKNLSGIDPSEYIKDLTRNLFTSYGVSGFQINLAVVAEGITLGMDTAVPCGLIINKLVSNSLKHAFPSGGSGEIRVELMPSERQAEGGNWYRLIVSDSGKGFPEDLDFRKTESLGLKIVCTLTEQLGGSIALERGGGIEVHDPLPGSLRPATATGSASAAILDIR